MLSVYVRNNILFIFLFLIDQVCLHFKCVCFSQRYSKACATDRFRKCNQIGLSPRNLYTVTRHVRPIHCSKLLHTADHSELMKPNCAAVEISLLRRMDSNESEKKSDPVPTHFLYFTRLRLFFSSFHCSVGEKYEIIFQFSLSIVRSITIFFG